MRHMMIQLVGAWTILVFSWMLYACPSKSTIHEAAQKLTAEYIHDSLQGGYSSSEEAEEALFKAKFLRAATKDYGTFLALWVGAFVTAWLIFGGILASSAYFWYRRKHPAKG
ncbi:hypothetical protein [Pseudomonas citronellolis]|uniref:hypothetical protein n=1 Tax=Pseudomonas citronellolis TaxID=53408 RepID=UPI00128EE54D|nr:hypothetical protein [Pseudomonas citronellolis]MCP1606019.1 hypothetical protein [Pseudomonas citronellolis]MCP1656571.1 hypothetical protein [Pseudomonas citronellolis]MCP1723600.1 hypothetical protein [Pseudomonas citronellolis]